MKKLAACLSLAVVLLGGCAKESKPDSSTPSNPATQLQSADDVFVVDVNVKGRLVTCVMWDSNDGSSTSSGMDCDWANAK